MMVMMRSSAMAASIQHNPTPVKITRVSTVVSISVSFAVLWSVCCGERVWGRSGVGLPPVEPSHALGDDGRAGLAVGGGAVGLGRCVVALDGEGARLATVRVNDGRLGGGRVHRVLLSVPGMLNARSLSRSLTEEDRNSPASRASPRVPCSVTVGDTMPTFSVNMASALPAFAWLM